MGQTGRHTERLERGHSEVGHRLLFIGGQMRWPELALLTEGERERWLTGDRDRDDAPTLRETLDRHVVTERQLVATDQHLLDHEGFGRLAVAQEQFVPHLRRARVVKDRIGRSAALALHWLDHSGKPDGPDRRPPLIAVLDQMTTNRIATGRP